MKKKRWAAVLLAAVLALSSLTGCLFTDDLYVEDEDYGAYKTDGTYTLMIYICGADLETFWGSATTDLREMIEGFNGNDCVNIIVQTGGAMWWQNPIVSASKCQRYKVTKNTIELVDDTIGQKCMSRGDTLSDFIKFAAGKYPADRYGLVLWNHGGGSASGYGYDENFSEDMMSLATLSNALAEGGIKYDFIGFDACLMACFETCLAVAPYTKYLIASEETEPGCGWYYKDWVRLLATEPTTDVTELGKKIVSTYIETAYKESPSSYSTLGMFDTEKVVNNVLPLINSMSASYTDKLNKGDYAEISRQRSSVREMADANDYVDLCALAQGNAALTQALADATVCFESTSNGSGDNGLSIYYPYHDLSLIDEVDEVYESIGYDVGFDDYINLFANIMAGGQISIDSDADASWFEGYDWFDIDDAYDSDYYAAAEEDYGGVEVTQKGDDYILELTDSDWDNISSITLNCFAMYDDFYIDFGADDYYELDSDDNLIVGYDEQWVAINGSIVPFYFEEHYGEDDSDYLTYGYVPCKYNDNDAQLVLAWDTAHPSGYAAGVRLVYEDSRISPKGMMPLKDGDVIQPYYDEYDENMQFVDKITIEDEKIEVKGELTVSYEDVTEQLGDTFIYYEIFDLFNNSYTTEPIIYE